MTVYITAVTPRDAGQHEHVTGVRWLDSSNSTSKTMSREQAVDWVQTGHQLFVAGAIPYLRTVANGVYTDNLLSLPRY